MQFKQIKLLFITTILSLSFNSCVQELISENKSIHIYHQNMYATDLAQKCA